MLLEGEGDLPPELAMVGGQGRRRELWKVGGVGGWGAMAVLTWMRRHVMNSYVDLMGTRSQLPASGVKGWGEGCWKGEA